MDLQALDDHELLALLNAVGVERERRANLTRIPTQIQALAQTYRDGGGDEQALTDALTPEQVAALNKVPTEPEPAAAGALDYLDT